MTFPAQRTIKASCDTVLNMIMVNNSEGGLGNMTIF